MGCFGFFDVAIDESGLAFGGNADLGPAFGADPLFAGQERFDVQLMPVGAVKLDSHRDGAARSPLTADPRPWAKRRLIIHSHEGGCRQRFWILDWGFGIWGRHIREGITVSESPADD